MTGYSADSFYAHPTCHGAARVDRSAAVALPEQWTAVPQAKDRRPGAGGDRCNASPVSKRVVVLDHRTQRTLQVQVQVQVQVRERV